jgi:hypothetical protein
MPSETKDVWADGEDRYQRFLYLISICKSTISDSHPVEIQGNGNPKVKGLD